MPPANGVQWSRDANRRQTSRHGCSLRAWVRRLRHAGRAASPIGPRLEPICEETMRRAPDLSWRAPERGQLSRDHRPVPVTLGELRFHCGELVRVDGVLHAAFEWAALYPSRAALEDGWRGPWIALASPWPDEAERWWRTRGPSISDRCVRLEGWYQGGAAGHLGACEGAIDVVHLAVWSEPHGPFDRTPPAPPPPPRR